jgi:hypothetical protein
MVNAILKSNPNAKQLYIVDTRPKVQYVRKKYTLPVGVHLVSSGRNPDFSEFRFRPELIKKAWPEPGLCRFKRDRISNIFGRNVDYTRKMYTLNTSLWCLSFNVCQSFYSYICELSPWRLEVSACLAADKVTYDYIWLNKSVPVPAGT